MDFYVYIFTFYSQLSNIDKYSIMYKVYLQNNDSSIKAIRKFGFQSTSEIQSIRSNRVSNYHATRTNCQLNFSDFCLKVISIFPEISNEEFTISWKGNYYI